MKATTFSIFYYRRPDPVLEWAGDSAGAITGRRG